MTPRCSVSSYRPLPPVSQSLSWEGVGPRLACDFSLRSCISRVFVVTPHACAAHFIGSQGSSFCPLLIFHVGRLEPAWCWSVYIMFPSLWPEKQPWISLKFMIGPQLPPLSHLAQNPLLDAFLHLDKQADIPMHEWIENVPVPKDKSIMWRRGCSGKTLGYAVARRIGPMI